VKDATREPEGRPDQMTEDAIRRCNACTAPSTCSEFGHCPLEVTPGQIAYEAYVEHFNSKSVCSED